MKHRTAVLAVLLLAASAGAQEPDYLYVVDLQGNRIEAVDLSSNLLVPSRRLEVFRPRGIAFSEGGDRIYVSALDTLHVFHPTDGPQQQVALAQPLPLVGDFDFNGRTDFEDFLIFASGFGKQSGSTGFLSLLDLVPDGAVDFQDFLVFASAFGKTSSPLDASRAGSKIALSPDESHAFITQEAAASVGVFELGSLEAVAAIPTGTGPSGMAMPTDRSVLYAADKDRGITAVDTESRALRATFDIGGIGNARVAVDPSGQRIYTARIPDPDDDAPGYTTLQLVALDASTGEVVDTLTVGQTWEDVAEIAPDAVIDLRLSATGARLYASLQRSVPGPPVSGLETYVEEGALIVVDTEGFALADDIVMGDAIGQFTVSPDAQKAYVVAIESFQTDPFLRLFILDLPGRQKAGSIGGFVVPIEFGFASSKLARGVRPAGAVALF